MCIKKPYHTPLFGFKQPETKSETKYNQSETKYITK